MKSFGIGFVVGASLSPTVASTFSTVEQKIKATSTALRDAQKRARVADKALTARAHLSDTKTQYKNALAAGTDTAAMRDSLKQAASAYAKARTAAGSYGMSVKNLAAAHKEAGRAVAFHTARVSHLNTLKTQKEVRADLQGQLMGTVASVMAVAKPLKDAISFESSFADLKKVANFKNKDQEKAVTNDIFDAAKMSGIDINKMSQIAAAGAESGVVLDANKEVDREKLKVFLTDAARMSVAYGISAEEAGERMANMQSRMGLSADETREMADSMNYIGSKMNATAARTSKVVNTMGGLAKGVGLSTKAIAGLAAALVSTSESPEIAGTAMKKFLTTLASGDAMTKEQKDTLGSMGIDYIDLAKKMKAGGSVAEGAILKLLAQIKTLPEHMQAAAAQKLFGLESLAPIAPLVNDLNKLKEAWKLAYAEEAKGSMLAEFETRSKTTQGAIDRMKVSLSVLSTTVGSVLLPPLTAFLETVTPIINNVAKFADENKELTKFVIGAATGLVAFKVATMATAWAFSGLTTAWTGAKMLASGVEFVTGGLNKTLLRSRAISLANATATKVATGAQWLLNTALAANPIGLVVAGLAALVGWFAYAYNETGSLAGAVNLMWDQFKAVVPIMHVIEGAFTGTVQFVKDLWNGVSLHDAGAKLFGTFVDGIKSMLGAVAAPFKTVVGLFGFGDGNTTVEKTAPVPTMQTASSHASTNSSAPAPNSPQASRQASTNAASGSVSLTQQFTFNGIPDADFARRVIAALEAKKSDFERLISGIVQDQGRLSYGS